MRTTRRLGTLFGVPIQIHISWVLIFLFVTVSLALIIFPRSAPFLPERTYWALGLVTSLLFFLSILAHELAHSLMASAQGLPTVSITFFIFGGLAQLPREPSQPREELLMALVGPLTSLGLGLLCLGLAWTLSPLWRPLAVAASWLGAINLLLAAFNLLPGFPLDGGRVLRALLWGLTSNYWQATRIATFIGHSIAYGLMLLGVLLALRGSLINGLWLAFVGWFLSGAASANYRQAQVRERLRPYSARDLMSPHLPTVDGQLTLETLVEDEILATGQSCFLIVQEGRLQGLVTLRDVRAVPKDRWPTTRVAETMTSLPDLQTASPDDNAYELFQQLDGSDLAPIPVLEGEQVVGLIGREDLLRFLRTRAKLGL